MGNLTKSISARLIVVLPSGKKPLRGPTFSCITSSCITSSYTLVPSSTGFTHMSAPSSQAERAYTNVMERLVAEEVERQKAKLPPKLREYIKTVEVETYALNRLPALYASSEKGWQLQYEKAGKIHAEAVSKSVRQGIAAVQVDPLRASQPLSVRQNDESEVILSTFRNMLNQPDLGWEDILYKCKRILLPRNHPDRPPLRDESQHKAYWQPGAYGGSESWEKARLRNSAQRGSALPSSAQNEEASRAWSDPHYRQ
jgi:hypothetical protein